MRTQPYFMKNKEWYKFNDEKWKLELTELGKADPKVVASYDEYYKKEYDEDGNEIDV